MKKIIATCILITFVFSQQGIIENVVAAQRTDGSHIVDISYDLLPDELFVTYTVFAEISFDGGTTFEQLNVSITPNVIGDNVLAGDNKTFIWHRAGQYDDVFSDEVVFKIVANGHEAITFPSSWDDNPFVTLTEGEFSFNDPSCDYAGNAFCGDGSRVADYSLDVMKFEVTNAMFAEFLIDQLDSNMVYFPAGGCGTNCNNIMYRTDESPLQFPFHHSCGDYSILNNVFTYDGHSYNDCGGASGDCDWNVGYSWNEDNEVDVNDTAIGFNGTTFVIKVGYANHPVVKVTFFGAVLFAEWYGMRLPTFEEYQRMSRGNDGRLFPWGDTWEANRVNYWSQGDPFENSNQSNTMSTTPVGFFNGQIYEGYQTIDTPGPFGIYDLIGNATEYVIYNNGVFLGADGNYGRIKSDDMGEGWKTGSSSIDDLDILIYLSYPWYLSDDDGVPYSCTDANGGWDSSGFRCVRTVNPASN